MKLLSNNLFVGLLLGFSVGVVVTAAAVSYMYSSSYTKGDITAQKFRVDTAFVIRATDEINRHLPMMIDADTRLDATSGAGNRFIYFFSLINISKDEIAVEELEAHLLDHGANDICSSKIFTKLRENGISVSLKYRDKVGIPITTVEIDDAICYRI